MREYLGQTKKLKGKNRLGIVIVSLIVTAILISAIIVAGTFKSKEVETGNKYPYISARDLTKILGSNYNLINVSNQTGENLMMFVIGDFGEKSVLSNIMANYTNDSGGYVIIIVTVLISSSIAGNSYIGFQFALLNGGPIQGSYDKCIYSLYYKNTFNIRNITDGWSAIIYNNNQTFAEIYINGNYTEKQANSVVKEEIQKIRL